jgi:hypothetical protein
MAAQRASPLSARVSGNLLARSSSPNFSRPKWLRTPPANKQEDRKGREGRATGDKKKRKGARVESYYE